MTLNAYEEGNLPRISADFDVADTDTDPTTITATVLKPDGTVTSYVYGVDVALVRDLAGEFHLDVAVDQPGDWTVLWRGTGAAVAASENTFYVYPRKVPV